MNVMKKSTFLCVENTAIPHSLIVPIVTGIETGMHIYVIVKYAISVSVFGTLMRMPHPDFTESINSYATSTSNKSRGGRKRILLI